MIDFLTYDLKVAAILAVFYMFYRVLLARETFHRVNRVVLLATAVASFVLPLCVVVLCLLVMSCTGKKTELREVCGTLDGPVTGVAMPDLSGLQERRCAGRWRSP